MRMAAIAVEGGPMNIFDQAMEFELIGEKLYGSLAKTVSDEGVAYIFERLAGQEKRHYATFKCMKEDLPVTYKEEPSIKSVRDIFKGWKDSGKRLSVMASQVDLYRKALDVEDQSVKLYEDGARAADDAATSAVFLKIAAEERHHRLIMENIIEFVTKPDFWYEHAEYGYRGEDYYL
jgi:rubrerythrin